jgi:hypothetical protein
MAGTYADISTLAGDAAFKAKIKVALMQVIADKLTVQGGPNSGDLALCQRALDSPDDFVTRAAWPCAADIPAIAAAAPAVPSDADVKAAVTVVFPFLVR